MDYDMKIFQACTNLDPLPTLDSLLDLRSVYLPCNAVNTLSVALNVCNGLIYESLSDVGEIRVWFASKILTPCRMH